MAVMKPTLFLLLLSASWACAQPHYTVTDLPGLWAGAGVNNLGEVTGRVPDPNNIVNGVVWPLVSNRSGDAAIFKNGKITNLASPAEQYPNVSYVGAINDFGEVVGLFLELKTGFGLYTYRPGQKYLTVTNVPIWTDAHLNNLGDIVGTMVLADGETSVGVLYRNGVITYLGVPYGVIENRPVAINDWGQIIGASQLGNETINGRPFLWQNGQLQILSIPNVPIEDVYAVANAINNQGQIAGTAVFPASLQEPHPASWQNSKIRDLGVLPGTENGSATAINNLGVVIGYCQSDVGPYVYSTFIYINGKMYDLNSLLVPKSGYTVKSVAAINDFGVIVAQASYVSDSATAYSHTVVLTPHK